MLGASWVDKHNIAAPAAQHNRPLHALPLAADRIRMKCFVLCSSSEPAQWWQGPIRRADLPALPALAVPETPDGGTSGSGIAEAEGLGGFTAEQPHLLAGLSSR